MMGVRESDIDSPAAGKHILDLDGKRQKIKAVLGSRQNDEVWLVDLENGERHVIQFDEETTQSWKSFMLWAKL